MPRVYFSRSSDGAFIEQPDAQVHIGVFYFTADFNNTHDSLSECQDIEEIHATKLCGQIVLLPVLIEVLSQKGDPLRCGEQHEWLIG
ncbi:hypothetical protein [Paraburkholderia metrosideri]|uniref:Uncharacterized protein n=1 Tax=Paraburkholderia metrosideri TaxID=580937 RepID=A0ABW9E5Z9_9BURK